MANYKHLRLIGKTITPIIVRRPFWFIKGCKVTIAREPEENERGYLPFPRKTHYGKLTKGERQAPTNKHCYQGFVIVDIPMNGSAKEQRLDWFLGIEGLGVHQNEGMGKVRWLERKEISPIKKSPQQKKLVIQKGLGYYSKPMITAIKALLLHDFVHTEKHDSKIYNEVIITSPFIREACKNHHNEEQKDNWLIPIIKKYDGLASFLTRKIPKREERRYDYENGIINCKAVASEIEERQENVHALYNYIYYNKTFARFYETINYTNNKLRKHLLLTVNLFMRDFKKGRIKMENNKVVIVSPPTTEKEEETKKFLSGSKVLKCIYPSKKELVRPKVVQTSFQESTVQSENQSKERQNKPACDGITKQKR